MDATCKKAFLIIIGIPAFIFLVAGWIFLGGEKVQGDWFNGIFDDFSLMILPTVLFLLAGWIIDKIIFNGSLMNCLKTKSLEK